MLGAGQLQCQWDIPESPEGMDLDPKLVNVEFTEGGGQTQSILKVADANDCAQGGWYYDNETMPTTIYLCPSSCDTVQADDAGKIDILFGCATVIK